MHLLVPAKSLSYSFRLMLPAINHFRALDKKKRKCRRASQRWFVYEKKLKWLVYRRGSENALYIVFTYKFRKSTYRITTIETGCLKLVKLEYHTSWSGSVYHTTKHV